jgi:hypothetical protein
MPHGRSLENWIPDIELAHIELAHIERGWDRCLPGKQTALRNEALRATTTGNRLQHRGNDHVDKVVELRSWSGPQRRA